MRVGDHSRAWQHHRRTHRAANRRNRHRERGVLLSIQNNSRRAFSFLLHSHADLGIVSEMRDSFWSNYWAGQLKEGKGCRQTLDCYCVSCELLSASIADALWFVNMVCLPLIAERNAHEICLTQECLVRRLLWKQTTTHSLHNNNPIFDGNLCPLLIDQPSTSLNILSYTIVPVERILLRTQNYRNCMRVRGAQCPYWWQ